MVRGMIQVFRTNNATAADADREQEMAKDIKAKRSMESIMDEIAFVTPILLIIVGLIYGVTVRS